MLKPVFRTMLSAGLLGAAALAANPAGATAIAHSQLIFHDVGITPSAGTVQFTGPWILQAQASANNSLGEFDSHFNEMDGPGTVTAGAAVTWASASGIASDPPPTPPYLDIGASATADGNIPGMIDGSTIAQGRGTVRRDRDEPVPPETIPPASYFEIVGGNPGDPVSVTFSVLIDYGIQLFTDQYGVLAEGEAIFGQELYGVDVGFVLVNWFDRFASIGPNSFWTEGATDLLLTNTLQLTYGTRYALLNEADAEIRVVNAAPELDMSSGMGAWVFVLFGALWLNAPAGKTRKHLGG